MRNFVVWLCFHDSLAIFTSWWCCSWGGRNTFPKISWNLDRSIKWDWQAKVDREIADNKLCNLRPCILNIRFQSFQVYMQFNLEAATLKTSVESASGVDAKISNKRNAWDMTFKLCHCTSLIFSLCVAKGLQTSILLKIT